MKKLHLLLTDKPSRLLVRNDKPFVLMLKEHSPFANNDTHTYQNIYITSDEEIKEGDWYYDTNDNESLFPIYRRSQDPKFYSGCKKIILTTDPQLIANGVQAIDDEFLEWFVKNPNTEYVEVEQKDNWYVHTGSGKYWEDEPVRMKGLLNLGDYVYKIIIPQEEPKQETNMSNITANQLIKDWKKTLESEWIQLDNLDEAKLVFDEEGNVVVENEHGTQFPVSDLSDVELDIFYTNLI
jgi:hypothetical protein